MAVRGSSRLCVEKEQPRNTGNRSVLAACPHGGTLKATLDLDAFTTVFFHSFKIPLLHADHLSQDKVNGKQTCIEHERPNMS